MEAFNLTAEIQKLAQNTSASVSKAIRKYKLNTSTSESVIITITQFGQSNYRIVFDFRASLMFQDMGAGKGWSKGVKLTQATYELSLITNSVRKQKILVNKKIYWMINALKDVGKVDIIDQTISSYTLNLTASNVRTS